MRSPNPTEESSSFLGYGGGRENQESVWRGSWGRRGRWAAGLVGRGLLMACAFPGGAEGNVLASDGQLRAAGRRKGVLAPKLVGRKQRLGSRRSGHLVKRHRLRESASSADAQQNASQLVLQDRLEGSRRRTLRTARHVAALCLGRRTGWPGVSSDHRGEQDRPLWHAGTLLDPGGGGG